MRPQTLLRLLLTLFVVALFALMAWAIAPYMHAILIGAIVVTAVLIVLGVMWQRHIVRDEATPPKVSGPEPSASVMRSLDRPVVPGRVLARKDERPRRKVQA